MEEETIKIYECCKCGMRTDSYNYDPIFCNECCQFNMEVVEEKTVVNTEKNVEIVPKNISSSDESDVVKEADNHNSSSSGTLTIEDLKAQWPRVFIHIKTPFIKLSLKMRNHVVLMGKK